ncbi:peptidase [Photobacterium damselae]|uniref:peptidase n=1 Tax=Photobacterium damselae TaxID=38293 RepID=UPI00406909F4
MYQLYSKFSFILFSLILSGCSSIQHYEKTNITLGTHLQASIGSSIFQISKTKDLPNAFGSADIYGGKVNTGYSDLRFMGLSSNKELIFRFTDIVIDSNETTMSRYGVNVTHVNSDNWGNLTATTYSKPTSSTYQLPPNTVEFKVPKDKKTLPINGYTVQILNANEYSIEYIVTK